jgi:hypothetical protein
MSVVLSLPELCCLGLMCAGCGAFTGLVLLAWLEDSQDGRTGLAWSAELGLDSNYAARAQLHYEAITSRCAYCRCVTNSQWCARCRVYFCLRHNVRAHHNC